MAYITSEEVKQIREKLKSTFPKTFKFSVVRENSSCIRVALMESPLDFKNKSNNPNSRQLSTFNHKVVYNIINDIVNEKNYDNSDSMIDYFDVGYYSDITLGKWDKPYKQYN